MESLPWSVSHGAIDLSTTFSDFSAEAENVQFLLNSIFRS